MRDYTTELKKKIVSRKAVVAVVGAGYVGLPLAVEKAKVGFTVWCIDRNEKRVDQISRGENYILDVNAEELAEVVSQGKLKASTDYGVLDQCDVVIICVPTPLTINREPDLQYIVYVSDRISEHLHEGMLVSLESTTYPGTTEEVILPRLEKTGLKVGQELFLAFSPERVDPGNARYTTKNTNKLVGGVTLACLDVASTFYGQTILTVIPVSSPAVAEMAKVFENTYRAVNIALVNEMCLLCDRMGLSVWEVLDAAFTKPFGIQPFYPGPGVGGHCIPLDPSYLSWKAREYDFSTRFIELAIEINLRMPYFVIEKARRMLGDGRKS
ncbi:MAG: nucleotide sugar dehydrogenase, partial [Dethiobacteria bacterium]